MPAAALSAAACSNPAPHPHPPSFASHKPHRWDRTPPRRAQTRKVGWPCLTPGRHVARGGYFATHLQAVWRAEGRAGNADRETCIDEIYLIRGMSLRFWRRLRRPYGRVGRGDGLLGWLAPVLPVRCSPSISSASMHSHSRAMRSSWPRPSDGSHCGRSGCGVPNLTRSAILLLLEKEECDGDPARS